MWNRLDPPNRYTFTVKDEGAAAQLAVLYEFFNSLPFWRMQPFDGVVGEGIALADRGRVYVVYLPHGGSTSVDLSDTSARFSARWLDPRDGSARNAGEVRGGDRRSFAAPDSRDWVVHLERREEN